MNELTKNPPKAPTLKPSYQAYADSILNRETQRQSALNAGFGIKTADTQANRMSKNEKVVAYIAYHRRLQTIKNDITREDVVPVLRKIIADNKDKRPQLAVSACAELSKIGKLYEPAAIANIVVNHNALTVVHAPGALEASKEEKKKFLATSPA